MSRADKSREMEWLPRAGLGKVGRKWGVTASGYEISF